MKINITSASADVDILAALYVAIEWHNDNCADGEELEIEGVIR